jgi:alpha,alpha-trehalose phosphorylase
MIDRAIEIPPVEQYPIEPWRYIQKKVDAKYLGKDESIFSISNGYIGIRGSFLEGEPVVQSGTFVSGFHETWPIQYGEEAYGFAKTGQTMLNVTDASIIKLYIDDEPFSLRHAHCLEFERALDFKEGILKRTVIWDTAGGKQVKIESERLVSFPERHVAAIKYKITLLNDNAHVAVTSGIECDESMHKAHNGDDPRSSQIIPHQIYRPGINRARDQRIILGHDTAKSKMKLVCGIDHTMDTMCQYHVSSKHNDNTGLITYIAEGVQNEPITLYKFITYHTSSHFPSFEDLADRAERSLDRIKTNGYDRLKSAQREYLDTFWERSDIKIEEEESQFNQLLRFHIFHLLQASARVQNSGIGAKGLTGPGYEGHAFWDIEIYVMPFLIYNLPRVAKNLLLYRYNMLDKAREWARELNHKGALFPWRTINGEEASAFFAAGTAQYHINADIVYAIKKYVEITHDHEFLCNYGAEILVETARLWADIGFYGKDGQFQIHGVTGPDEYSAIVNNNCFTNYMARENLYFALKVIREMEKEHPEKYNILIHQTKLKKDELVEWKSAADHMYIPFNRELGINPQDDKFLQNESWDLKSIPKERFPLLLYYHPLMLYRYQVIKQADIVLAMFLLGNNFSKELKKRNFDYYDPITTGDSSLSVSIQGIMAAELGYADLVIKYFTYTMLMDVADVGGNVEHGLHLASMGGIWMSVVYGIAGMRDYDGELTFAPRLWAANGGIAFKLNVRKCLLSIDIKDEHATYELLEGEEISFKHWGIDVVLKNGEKREMEIHESVRKK